MAREIPEAVRAAAGLAATFLDEARRLPETLPGLPVRVLGLAMQLSMRLQQHYAGLVARGDELLTGFRGEDEPGLATFDDDDVAEQPATGSIGTSPFDRVAETIIEVTEDDDADAAVDEALAELTAEEDEALEELAAEEDEALEELAIEELAIEELAEQAAGEDGAAALADALLGGDAGSDADGLPESAVLETSPVPGADAPSVDEPAPSDPGGSPVGEAAGAPDLGTTVDVVTPEGEVATVDAAVTDEGVAAVEGSGESAGADGGTVSGAASDTGEVDTPAAGDTGTDTDSDTDTDSAGPATDEGGTGAGGADTATDEGGTPVAAATGVSTSGADDAAAGERTEDDASTAASAAVDAVGPDPAASGDGPEGGSDPAGSQAAGSEPVEGYDGWSIAQLRGRLRGYQVTTVADLVAYEEATRAREPYLRMLRNRLEKLDQQAVEASPLAPRG